MSELKRSTTLRMVTVLATVAGVAAVVLLLRGAPAQAQVQVQGPMSAPACQCSAPVSITGMTSRVAHCLCGPMSCAITETGDARQAPVMQCVRQ
jgi:hypothetical protein